MGLTIYYRMKARVGSDAARELIRRLHAFVSALPFDEVTPIFEYDPPDGICLFKPAGAGRWKPGSQFLERKRADGLTEHVQVPSLHVVCFHANLRGSETATFGLASHPPVVVHREDVVTQLPGGGEERRIEAGATVEFNTRLRGWYSWSNCVKTQYAGNPKLGGVKNFLRAHHSVFAAIDECKRLGMTVRIRDDGKYWRHRSDDKLVVELKRWDELVAGIAGKLTDVLGSAPGVLVAPIKERPDFEHLEARGAKQLAKPRKKARSKKPAPKRRKSE